MKTIENQLKTAKSALKSIAKANKFDLLHAIANTLLHNSQAIQEANQLDLNAMDPSDPKYDRLVLNEQRIRELAKSIQHVANLPDPTNQVLSSKKLMNGLLIEKKSVPLGVVGVIYESRPNVTVDVAALCIQSGNVCVLRGGTDAWHTNSILVNLIQKELKNQNLEAGIVQLLPTDRDLVEELLTATKYVDIIIPRGSQTLINFVREHAKVPVIETGAGVCHTYVEQSADLEKAAKIVANAKISRPSVCNALDTILVDKVVAKDFLTTLSPYFEKHNVEILADEASYRYLEAMQYPLLSKAQKADFGREFLDLKCSIALVDSMMDALNHIATFSSKHSECIVSTDQDKISQFMQEVDAAAVYANASTRFTDGGEFGLGAEIGISTQKLHARGPFALEKLVTEKWFVIGDGQIR